MDCEGVANGPAVPGTACDDLDPNTGNDTYQADCTCAGIAVDCEGVPGGPANPGSLCDHTGEFPDVGEYDPNCICVFPDIEDPCSCGNPNNIDVGDDLIIEFFYETVVISSGTGETWMMEAGASNVLDAGGGATNPTFSEGPPGIYTANFYHPAGVGYSASFTNGAISLPISNSCEADCNISAEDVPTMSQWGLIILALLTLNFLFLSVITAQVKGPRGASASVNLISAARIRNFPFNRELFKHAAILTALFVLAITGWTLSVYGLLALTDIIGTAIAAPLFAYMLHIVALMNKQNN